MCVHKVRWVRKITKRCRRAHVLSLPCVLSRMSMSVKIFLTNANERNFCQNKLISMALFLSLKIHQGDKRFIVHSRGHQCAFITLSAILTAQNMP